MNVRYEIVSQILKESAGDISSVYKFTKEGIKEPISTHIHNDIKNIEYDLSHANNPKVVQNIAQSIISNKTIDNSKKNELLTKLLDMIWTERKWIGKGITSSAGIAFIAGIVKLIYEVRKKIEEDKEKENKVKKSKTDKKDK